MVAEEGVAEAAEAPAPAGEGEDGMQEGPAYLPEEDRPPGEALDAEPSSSGGGGGRGAAGAPLLTEQAAAMDPDHPLLERAQRLLKDQLEAKRAQLHGELKEKRNALKRAQQQREAVGVELYGFQQTLAKLQLALAKAQEGLAETSEARQQIEADVAAAQALLEEQLGVAKQERAAVERSQRELDRLGETLKQVKSEIAVTKRAAHAAEEAVQRLEKEKQRQDFLIDGLQGTLRSLQQQLSQHAAQLDAQRRETRAARETLAEAEADMEGVAFEKKQLLAQWKSSLNAIQRRDEALAAIEEAMRQQREQERAIDTEAAGFKRDIERQQIANEQLDAIARKAEAEADAVSRQVATFVERQERVSEEIDKLAASLGETEERLRRAGVEGRALSHEAAAVDRAAQRAAVEAREVEVESLRALSGATTAEKSSAKTAADIQALRAACDEEELRIASIQNELAKLQVDVLNTEAHNGRLAEALALLEAELKDKEAAVARYELDLKRRGDEIERRTRDIDALNRKYEKVVAARPEAVSAGPLEAAIASLGREIDSKGAEGRELQRRWLNKQTELVALQAENGRLQELLQRRKAEVTVLTQKRARLERQLERQEREAKSLRAAGDRLQTELARVDGLIGRHEGLKAVLREEQTQLEGRAMAELRGMEEDAARLGSSIDEGAANKQQLVADLIEVERQIMLWERKIQLEREMQEVLDPTVGEGVVASMGREVRRMELRLAELLRLQEALMQELERTLSKHEIIGMKKAAQASVRAKASGAAEATAKRSMNDLKRMLRDAEREASAAEARLRELGQRAADAEGGREAAGAACGELRARAEALRERIAAAALERHEALLATAAQQRLARRYEEIASGRYRPAASDPAQLEAEVARAEERRGRVVAALGALRAERPQLAAEVDRVLAHDRAVAAALQGGGGGGGLGGSSSGGGGGGSS
ncbi:hypothetical protein Rsub_03158 [Raphidocelis subcapitata]|uniref:Uncharacterized protein n=1 Tax=Raphidocelis subcapitata TaxID=307507 RepID=A0A2V0NSH7_9CHLO|nr:hypothetical protein Rsub_03158 [Raphidocelis subcapitata]|eukprot:GBF90586.1 hypothetical protein Rsub_03158 [Raphidocelis subcapitata]